MTLMPLERVLGRDKKDNESQRDHALVLLLTTTKNKNNDAQFHDTLKKMPLFMLLCEFNDVY